MRLFALLSPTLRGRMTLPPARSRTGPPGAGPRRLHAAAPRLASAPSRISDEKISAPLVRLVDPQSGELQGPFRPADILGKIDRKEFLLLQVAEGALQRGSKEWALKDLPVCRLVSKREAYQREREKKKSAAPTSTKGLQLSWNVSANDLAHKVERARRDLERGHRVNVNVVARKGTPRVLPGSEAADQRLQLIEQLQHDLCAPPKDQTKPIGSIASPPKWKNDRSVVEFTVHGLAARSS